MCRGCLKTSCVENEADPLTTVLEVFLFSFTNIYKTFYHYNVHTILSMHVYFHIPRYGVLMKERGLDS